MPDLLLGLIGDNIAASRAPELHGKAGRLTGVDVQYDRLVPRELGTDFDGTFQLCMDRGYRAVNITYPYKEKAAAKAQIDNPLVRAMGAVNTLVFDGGAKPKGFNTDYSGFIGAYRSVRGDAKPGPVCMTGAGGVGKAVAFGLLDLGLEEIRLVERDLPKAEALASAMRAARPGLRATVTADPGEGANGAHGLVNCSPIGMVGYEGTPMPRQHMKGAAWAFDAVYTPVDTQFLTDAAADGLTTISGYELFFFQGVDAWRIFSGKSVDPAQLRAALADAGR